jgi:hypothetical protein
MLRNLTLILGIWFLAGTTAAAAGVNNGALINMRQCAGVSSYSKISTNHCCCDGICTDYDSTCACYCRGKPRKPVIECPRH